MIKMKYPENHYISCVFGVQLLGTHVVLIVELPENKDKIRISELYEHLATKVYKKYLKEQDPLSITWLEYYPPGALRARGEAITPSQKSFGSFSHVELKFDPENESYYDPTWNWMANLVAINRYGISINDLIEAVRCLSIQK